MAATNWIDRVYPIGAKVMTPDGIGWVENHTCEGGFKGTKTMGIMVELDNGEHVEFPDMMLSESGHSTSAEVYLTEN